MSDASHITSGSAGHSDTVAVTDAAVVTDPNAIPPAGEEIHLPGGSFIPVAIAISLTLILVGTTTAWLWTFIGAIGFVVSLAMWIRDTRREVAHLPDELGAPSHH